jgi:hypothetical protein
MHWMHDIAIGRYFRGQLGGRAIDRVLGRLGRCAGCRASYERHLMVESMLPDGEARRDDRLWEAITRSAGVALPPERPRARRLSLGLAAAAAVAVLLVVAPRLHAPRPGAEPVARGGATAPVVSPALFIYRSTGPRRSEPVARAIRPGDGLMLAYSNPSTDLRYLMVFAVDGGGRVYWYHPAYERAGENPAAVPIRTQAFGIELGDEVHHALAPGPLTMVALFLPRPRTVLEIEVLLARDGARADVPGGAKVTIPLEVRP